MVADLYHAEDQDWAVAYVVLSSVIGTSIGPIVGGPIRQFLPWNWNFWVQLIFGPAVQAVHFFMPESRATILMDREARRRRRTGQDPDIYGPNEVERPRISLREVGATWIRPFAMFACLIAVANYAIYMSTVSYMLAAYGPYSASATGGNGFARDLLAGIAALYAAPLYADVGPAGRRLEYASTILACLALIVTAPVYLIYWKGP